MRSKITKQEVANLDHFMKLYGLSLGQVQAVYDFLSEKQSLGKMKNPNDYITANRIYENDPRFEFVSLKDTSEILGVSKLTLYKLNAKGELTFYKLGTLKRTFVKISEVNALFKAG